MTPSPLPVASVTGRICTLHYRFDVAIGEGGGAGARQPRVRCPFYGFRWPEASCQLFQVTGNQCGLALDRVEPCAMEEAGQKVDMEACSAAKELAHFIRSADPVISFVILGQREGLSYADWWRCTMLRGCNSR